MKRFFISVLIIMMMLPGYGCAVGTLPAFINPASYFATGDSGDSPGIPSNPITTGIDFFITRNYAINLKLNICDHDSDINANDTPLHFDSGKIGPIVHCKYYF